MLLLSLKTHGETMDFPPAEAELVKLFAGTGEHGQLPPESRNSVENEINNHQDNSWWLLISHDILEYNERKA